MTMFTTVSPVNNQVYCELPHASEADIATALQQAAKMKPLWKSTSLSERAAVANKVVQYFETHATAVAQEITWQMGRPLTQALGEITGLVERSHSMIAQAEQALSPLTLPEKKGFSRFIQREPLGTVLVLAPWNYPYLTAINSIIPAIMAGNVVLLKHSSQTPLCAHRFAEAFKEADAPLGVFHYLHLEHAQVTALIQHPEIDFVTFTGSVEGGRRVQRAAADRFISLGLELGGKDAAYVRADADLSSAVANLVEGAFYNSGQSCCGVERLYIHDSIFDDFVTLYVEEAQQLHLANPLQPEATLGPMVKPQAADFVRQQIRDAVAAGAKTLLPRSIDVDPGQQAAYLSPQVLIDVDHNMAIMREETFGPAVGIMAVSNDETAVSFINDSDFGLTASIWTQDQDCAIALGRQLEVGTVYMNRCDYLDPALVWTGVKSSGRGYSLSALGYHQLTQAKSYHLKH